MDIRNLEKPAAKSYDDPILGIHREIMALQRHNRFVARAYGTRWSLSESHLMVELAGRSDLSAQELTHLLNLNKSTISRLIARLEQSNHIRTCPNPSDRRRRVLVITSAGAATLAEMDATANRLLKSFMDGLALNEQSEFLDLFTAFNDGLRSPPSIVRPSEHPMRAELRRISRGTGILGRNFMGSGISSTDWQLMGVIDQAPNPITASEIEGILGTDQSTTSKAVGRLSKEGFIKRTLGEQDRRTATLSLTSAGKSRLAVIEAHACEKYARPLLMIGKEDTWRLLELMIKFVGVSSSASTADPALQLKCHRLNGGDDRYQARKFFVEHAVKFNHHHKLPERLFASDSHCWIGEMGSRVRAVGEVQSQNERFKLCNFITDQGHTIDGVGKEFLRAVIDDLLAPHTGREKICLEVEGLVGTTCAELGGSLHVDGSWVFAKDQE